MLIEAHDEWQVAERRYLCEGSMAQINLPAPTVLTIDSRPTQEATTTLALNVGECPPGLSRCLTAETSAPSTGTELLANDIVRDIAYKAGLECSSDLYNQHCLVAALSHSK